MGAGDFLKGIYYSGEDAWYSFWDRIESVIPVYKIIDPVDEVIPTFALFLIIIFIILLTAGTMILGGFSPLQSTLTLTVVDSTGAPVNEATVTIEGIDEVFISNDFGLIGEIKVPLNSTLSVTAQKDSQSTTVPVIADSFQKAFTITLPIRQVSFSPKSIRFQESDGSLATGEIRLHYTCSQNSSDVPADDVIYTGTANVAQPDDCGTLSVTISSAKYQSATFTLSGPSGAFTLQSSSPAETVGVTINLKNNGQLITESVSVQAYSTNNSYLPIDTKSATNGQAQFTLPEGDYIFKTQIQQGYKAAQSATTNLSKSTGQKTVDIQLVKNILGIITVTVKRGSVPISGVYLTLNKVTSTSFTQVFAQDTNDSGTVQFEVAEEGDYTVIATKDDYCDASADVEIGDNKTINIKSYDGTCGNELTARVIDQDGKPVAYAKAAIFAQNAEDTYKLSYQEKITDYNGYVSWNPIKNSNSGEQYKVFAFKSIYSGWSNPKTFDAASSQTDFLVQLTVPVGNVKVTIKDADSLPVQFATVQLYDEYSATSITGKHIVENADGTIEFAVKADKKVYAVITKDGFEAYTSLPLEVLASGNTNILVELSKPPVKELRIKPLGLFKNGETVLKVEAGQEYDALFELTAPKDYEELGFFVRVGKEDLTKTELDKIFIKNASNGGVMAAGNKAIISGSTYNPPKGYSVDSQYLNLEESKWAQVYWPEDGFVQGKIIVGVKVKIRQTAQAEERLEIWSRAWGIIDGKYERDLTDSELGTSQNSSTKQGLYALAKPEYISVGIETLCDSPSADRSFCITATVTDPENFTKSFADSFDAKNNSTYNVSIRVVNNSSIGFDNAKTKLDNPENNMLFGEYTIISPEYVPVSGNNNSYEIDWVNTPNFVPNSPIDISTLKLTPQKTGSATLRLMIRDERTLLYEKDFIANISADKKMSVQYMVGGIFGAELPTLVSGKTQELTIKALNSSNGLEIDGAFVKLYDRFGTLLLTKTTNKLGVATLQIPASFPGEKLKLSVEAQEYETFTNDLKIAEDVVTTDPTTLTFTVNPQTLKEDKKTVRITNQTGFDLTVKQITLTGKFNGLLSESQIASWFGSMKGKVIKSQDYEEFVFKVVSATSIPTADDLTGNFEITLAAEGKEWVKEIPAKIRVGLGKDVDLASCLEITKNSWEATTRGQQVETSLEIRNNCTVDGKAVDLKNIGATISTTASVTGTFNAQTKTVQVELGSAWSRVFQNTLISGAKMPITIKFTPMAGSAGVATGSIIFEAQNATDSKSQKLTAEMKYNINYENLQDCLVIGANTVEIEEESTGSFSITNNCKSKATVIIEPEDLQAAITTKDFTLNSGESKDVSVAAQRGQIPGAYNVLISGKTQGTTLETTGNVIIIIQPKNTCFTMSRYIFDVYDSPYTETGLGGVDRGYLINNCTQKVVGAKVSGIIPADTGQILKSMLWGALVGGATGYFKNGKFFPDGWFDKKNKNVSQNIQEAYDNLKASNVTIATNYDTKTKNYVSYIEDIINRRINALNADANKIKTEVFEADYNNNRKVCVEVLSAQKNTEYTNFPSQKCYLEAKQYYDAQLQMVDAKLKELVTPLQDQNKKLYSAYNQFKSDMLAAQNSANVDTESSRKVSQQLYELQQMTQEKLSKTAITQATKNANGFKDTAKNSEDKFTKIAEDLESTLKKSEGTKLIDSINKTRHLFQTQTTPPYYIDNTPATWTAERPSIKEIPFDTTKLSAAYADVSGTIGDSTLPVALTPAESDIPNYWPESPTSDSNLPANGGPAESDIPNYWPESPTSDSPSPVSGGPAESNIPNYWPESITSTATNNTNNTVSVDNQPKITINAYTNYDYDGKDYYTNDGKKVTDKDIIGYLDKQKHYTYEPGNKYVSGVYITDKVSIPVTSQFILATATSGAVATSTTSSTSNTVFDALISTAVPAASGLMMPNGFGGAIVGGLINGFLSWSQAKDITVNESDAFKVNGVVFKEATLDSPDGITLSHLGDPVCSFASSNGINFGNTASSTGSSGTTNTTSSSTTGNILYNASTYSGTIGTVDERELEFTNATGTNQKEKFKPFVGVLTVTGDENVYDETYDYSYIKAAAEKRGAYKESSNFISDFFAPPTSNKALATMDSADLKVESVNKYVQKFHLLFDSWQYVDCGPKTFPCQAVEISNCDIDGKKGLTGEEGVPKISLKWGWDEIDAKACDSDTNPEYIYCDSTQLATSTLKKLMDLSEFFKTNALANCPTITDLGAVTQKLSDTALDVGITSLQTKTISGGASIQAIVETSNNLPMNATVSFKLTRQNGTEVKINGSPACPDKTKEFTSTATFDCNIKTTEVGVGTFNVAVTMSPTLCSGCSNSNTTNDTISSGFVLGTSGASQCQEYTTDRDYFEKVLAANNLLDTADGKKVLEYLSFKANLVRDGFTNDFKTDYDSFVSQLAGAPDTYAQGGIRDLFLSDKFQVHWPQQGLGPWEAGKYDAKLIITFKNNSWHWDNNNIESIVLDLEPQGDPEPYFSIYNVAFDGPVGLSSTDGRQGYGAGYDQKTEGIFTITNDLHSDVLAQPNTSNNAVTTVNVSIYTGTQAFDQLNNTPTRGNVLSIYRTGDVVDFTLTPSVAVPVILNVTRNSGVDAYAFYSAEVNGQPQETGSSFINWTGIGQGCVTFDGSPMQSYARTPDGKASSYLNGMEGYGFYWPLAKVSGTASFYGEFFAPQDSSTTLKMINAKDSANFESTMGNGSVIQASTNGGINTLSDVLDLVKQGKVCVKGGDYYWNNTAIREEMVDTINAKENTCIPSVR